MQNKSLKAERKPSGLPKGVFRKRMLDGTTGYKARVTIEGKRKERGPYRTPERAAQAREELARLHHGAFYSAT